MTAMQTSLPLLIVRPSILNPVMHFSTQPLTGEKKCPTSHTFALHISFHLPKCWCHPSTKTPSSLLIIIMSQHLAWSSLNDMIHSISSHDLFDPLILTLLVLHHRLGPSVPSLAQASPPRGPSLQSLVLPFLHCNRSIKPSLVLIFTTLVTWLHVMTHMQWVPSSHYMSIASTLSHFSSMAHVAHTIVFVWTNLNINTY